ncbi:hypothetical protein ASD42_20910 [Nocardia sp. Root136]|nr:hypothetical protein ASD42_20910 [Nocardia sp. Root136]
MPSSSIGHQSPHEWAVGHEDLDRDADDLGNRVAPWSVDDRHGEQPSVFLLRLHEQTVGELGVDRHQVDLATKRNQ